MGFSVRGRRGAFLLTLVWVLTGFFVHPAWAHVGSPDIYAEGEAGPYRLLVTVRPPQVIPGVAEIEVRAVGTGPDGASVTGIQIAPIPLTGEASLHPPVADAMKQSGADKQFFTGALWIMASGSWQVRFTVQGSRGVGVLSIPVPAISSSTKGMQAGLGLVLGALGLLLVAGVVGIVGAAARDSQLAAGATPTADGRRRALISMGVAVVVVAAAVWGGKVWWDGEADSYSKYVYKPLTMQAALGKAASGQALTLKIEDPGWLKSRRMDDFVLDHDHLMHLYLIRQPGMDVVFHLHPEQVATGEFSLGLPSMPAGNYRLYADVVHATGFPETLVASLTVSEISGRPLAGDDARGAAQPFGTNVCVEDRSVHSRFKLPDGYSLVWNNATAISAKTPQVFEFALLDEQGKPATDTALYMGMLGHAAFVKSDATVFAHVHPSGTVSMAALMMAAEQNSAGKRADSAAMASMPEMPGMASSKLPNLVGFPYGFPTAGAYRIFVQMKHGATGRGVVETGVFDACAR